MSNSFIPRAYQPEVQHDQNSEQPVSTAKNTGNDRVGSFLLRASQYIIIGFAFLLPVLFVPGLAATLGFTKGMLAVTFGLTALMLVSLAALRYKSVTTVVPLPLLLYWTVVLAAFASGILSGDVLDSVRGSTLSTQTAGFMAVIGLVMTLPLLLQRSKVMVLYTFAAFASGVGIVLLYNIIRFFAGPVLPFGSFFQVTTSPAGGLNDLAVLAALTIIISLITLLQLPLKLWMKVSVLCLSLMSLLVLMVANFFSLWIMVGFFSLLFLIYLLSRDTLFGETVTDESTTSPLLIVASLIICVVSGIFVVAGDFAGARISSITNVSYLEVRPSLGATIDTMRAVYQDDVLLGVGPNRFSDAWREHKDRSINETTFWNVNFEAGFGLVPTLFVTLGLLGGLLFVAFNASYLFLAYRTLLRSESQDSFWFYTGTASFASAVMLWTITYFYVPGVTVMLAAALFTGISFVAYQALIPASASNIVLASNRRRGLLLMTVAVVVVVLSILLIFTLGKQYSAQSTFTNAVRSAESVEQFENSVQRSYQLYRDDRFLNALNQLKIQELQGLLTIQEPTEEDQARFGIIAQQAIALAQESIARDSSSPQPYIALAEIYNTLSRAGLEGAEERVYESLAAAELRDPLNPTYNFSRGFVSASKGDFTTAKQNLADSLALKSNFTQSLFLLSQIAIEEGDVESAIATTRQVASFEPNNPTRYYQLGILLAANNELDEAIAAYQAALQLDPNYANARYMLGLSYVAQGNSDAALNQFRTVQAENVDNQQLQSVISELESTGTLQNLNLGLEAPVEESAPAENTEDGVVASDAPETDLISPVNTEAASEEVVTETEAVEVTPETETLPAE